MSMGGFGIRIIKPMLLLIIGWKFLILANFAIAATGGSIGEGVLLAQAYEHGEGVPKDLKKAADLYCASGRQGDENALYALGWMYANGRGVERDEGYAKTLLEMAAYLGHPHAERVKGLMGEYTGVTPDCIRQTGGVDSDKDISQVIQAFPESKRKIVEIVINLATEFQIEPRLALAFATVESNFNASAISSKNAMGVMQLIPATAERFNVRNPFEASDNVRGGLAYLQWLLAYFRGDVALAAAGYNAGEGAVDKFKGIPPYRETKGYVERILAAFPRRYHPFNEKLVVPSKVFTGSAGS